MDVRKIIDEACLKEGRKEEQKQKLEQDVPMDIYRGLSKEQRYVLASVLNAVGEFKMKPDVDEALSIIAQIMNCRDEFLEKIGSK